MTQDQIIARVSQSSKSGQKRVCLPRDCPLEPRQLVLVVPVDFVPAHSISGKKEGGDVSAS